MAQPEAVLLAKLPPDGDWSFEQQGAYTVATDKSGKHGDHLLRPQRQPELARNHGTEPAWLTAPASEISKTRLCRHGASILAKQPVDTVADDSEPDEAWSIAYPQLESRLGQLRNCATPRGPTGPNWRSFFLPQRYAFLVVSNRMWRGSPVNDQIVDSTPVKAVEICAAGLLSGLMNPSRKWFNLAIGLPWVELDAAGKEWLEDTTQKVETVLSGSNFLHRRGAGDEGHYRFRDVADDDLRGQRKGHPLLCAHGRRVLPGTRFASDRRYVLRRAQLHHRADRRRLPHRELPGAGGEPLEHGPTRHRNGGGAGR